MSMTFEKLEKAARALSPKEKAALARVLIEELDASADVDAEQLWIEEAQRRHDAFVAGNLPARSGDEVMNRVRSRLK
jgi:putative addiction module component (TIGR02574 family)